MILIKLLTFLCLSRCAILSSGQCYYPCETADLSTVAKWLTAPLLSSVEGWLVYGENAMGFGFLTFTSNLKHPDCILQGFDLSFL